MPSASDASPAARQLPPPGFHTWVTELVHAHRGHLLTYVRRRGLGPEDALDVVQDTFASFLTLPEARSIARVGDDAVKLLTVIARHNMLNRKRKWVRQAAGLEAAGVVSAGGGASNEALLAHADELTRVYGCVHRMNRLQRAAIFLSAVADRSGEDVAAILGGSPGHLRVLLHRARAHVRACPLDEMPALSARDLRDSLADS